MNRKNIWKDIALVIIGSILYGAGLSLFLIPKNVVMGGASGLAVTVHALTSLPVGVGILLINIPLLILNIRLCGWRSMARTIIGVFVTSVFTDLMEFLPAASEDALLSAFCGGALMGAGAGVMLPRGFTTGGSDLAAYLINRKIKKWSVGSILLTLDAMIIVGSAIVLHNFSGIIHSVAAALSYSMALNAMMNGAGRAKLSFIVSDHYEQISDVIMEKINRGATVLHGKGWYTGKDKTVVMCVTKRSELYMLEQTVHEIDPGAFMIISDAAQVLGEGFEEKDEHGNNP